MKFKDKLAKERPDLKGMDVDNVGCPQDFGFEDNKSFCPNHTCAECWNREIPEQPEPISSKATVHASICSDLTALYERKNHDYGDSFGKGFKEYGMTMPCIRLEDKLNRLKSLLKSDAQVKDESIDDTLMDLANYAIMTLIERKEST